MASWNRLSAISALLKLAPRFQLTKWWWALPKALDNLIGTCEIKIQSLLTGKVSQTGGLTDTLKGNPPHLSPSASARSLGKTATAVLLLSTLLARQARISRPRCATCFPGGTDLEAAEPAREGHSHLSKQQAGLPRFQREEPRGREAAPARVWSDGSVPTGQGQGAPVLSARWLLASNLFVSSVP